MHVIVVINSTLDTCVRFVILITPSLVFPGFSSLIGSSGWSKLVSRPASV